MAPASGFRIHLTPTKESNMSDFVGTRHQFDEFLRNQNYQLELQKKQQEAIEAGILDFVKIFAEISKSIAEISKSIDKIAKDMDPIQYRFRYCKD